MYVRKEGLFHIYTDRVGLHEFLQIVNYDFSYQFNINQQYAMATNTLNKLESCFMQQALSFLGY